MELDISETFLYENDRRLLEILLTDRTTGRRLRWGTRDYKNQGKGFGENDPISLNKIVRLNEKVIRPRVVKALEEQEGRTKNSAEVFTASWICNAQNNLVDEAWFGRKNVFNMEGEKSWTTIPAKVVFPEGRTWKQYVLANRMEVSIGEAPYLASRYDTVTGKAIAVPDRIGLLDRKLRIVTENVETPLQWELWAKKAVQSIYGYDIQGDNVLLSRENILMTVEEHYRASLSLDPSTEFLRKIAYVVSWNIWQMDALKFTVPNTCKPVKDSNFMWMPGMPTNAGISPCPGCATNDPMRHNGTRCRIRDWKINKSIEFIELLSKKGANHV